jgi:N6-adenosine-specific RNA methylase IME4
MKLYDIIYADPPWRYSFSKSDSRKIENQYPTMSLQEIKDLEVPAKDNCLLYLWATAPKLIKEALDVMEAWGFEYKTHAIWDKEKIGMGYWFRGQHELLLVGVRGKFSPPNSKSRIPSIFRFPRRGHSQKPIDVRAFITSWYPAAEKIELFAREQVPGWACWGDEV